MHTRALASSRPCAVVLKDSAAWHYCGKFTSERDFFTMFDGDCDGAFTAPLCSRSAGREDGQACVLG
jgi:hypothetical protein